MDRKAYLKEYRIKNKKKIAKNIAEWAKNNPDKVRAKSRRYNEKHKKEVLNRTREWRKKNKARIRKYNKRYAIEHREEISKRRKNYPESYKSKMRTQKKIWDKSKPWMQDYLSAKSRCYNPKDVSYKNYGARGIKCLMTQDGFEYLWNRDRGFEMKRPEIHRKDNDGNYTATNCEYIEGRLHRQIHKTKGVL